MNNRLVTEMTLTCQHGVGLPVRSVSGARPAAACAERLEDVEKFVRKQQHELEDLVEWLLECNDALVSRIEALEAAQRRSAAIVVESWSVE